ncbi:hypothetical protein, partial [Streptococcus gordonii]|uniref:hypothetical protein n=1 Tax=Streptococcus gordonii TaxID=1302 RepID=UPI001D096BB2
ACGEYDKEINILQEIQHPHYHIPRMPYKTLPSQSVHPHPAEYDSFLKNNPLLFSYLRHVNTPLQPVITARHCVCRP